MPRDYQITVSEHTAEFGEFDFWDMLTHIINGK